MAVNKFMHPRNIYKNPPDFKKLANNYPEFASISRMDVTGKISINFKDPKSLRVLTTCLLKADFDLDVSIPEDRLVPTLPLRLNYILWLEDLLVHIDRNDDIKGIDIGTGACAIYPLLAAKKNKWHMIGTETDDESLRKATENIAKNELQTYITLKKNTTNNTLEYLFADSNNVHFDFCMCNPPFYVSLQEVWESRSPARPPPKNGFTGSPQELITEGGELQFCRQILQESKQLKDNILIFTTMIGHKYNLKELILDLKSEGIKFTTTEFCQGRVTRWGIAWTYQNYDFSKLRPLHEKPKKKVPIVFNLLKVDNQPHNIDNVSERLKSLFNNIQIEYKVITKRKNEMCLDIIAYKNTWSNQRRKRRLLKLQQNETMKKFKIDDVNHELDTISKVCQEEKVANSAETLLKPDSYDKSSQDDKQISDSTASFESHRLEEKTIEIIKNAESNSEVELEMTKANTSKLSKSLDTGHSKDEPKTQDPLSHAIVKISVKGDVCSLCMEYLDGSMGKEGLHQIMQYIKNNWK